jgi:hypothetical protein
MKSRLRTLALFLLLGLIGTIGVCMILAVTVNNYTGGIVSAQRGDWTVTVATAPTPWLPAALRVISVCSPAPRANWSPLQATGAPDTPNAGDYATAWASATSSAQNEWLLLTYDQAIAPKYIDVYESYRPGAVTRATLITDDGTEIEAWSGTDPTSSTAASGTSRLPVSVPGGGKTPRVRAVKLYIGVPGLAGWNEIDAVGLIDADGTAHWASGASASSWYNQGSYTNPASGTTRLPEELLPSWARIAPPPAPPRPDAPVMHEEHGADARGWPLLALWAPFDPRRLHDSSTATAAAVGSSSSLTTSNLILLSGMGPSSGSYVTSTWTSSSSSSSIPNGPVLPWRPIWSGLAIDSILYGGALWLLCVIFTWPRRFFREVSRLRRGCCIACGYDLGYDFPRGCPECGWRREGGTDRAGSGSARESIVRR